MSDHAGPSAAETVGGASEIRLETEGLARLPEIVGVTLAHQRDRLAFYWNPSGRMELYVLDLASQSPIQISHGEVPATPHFSTFAWHPDGQSLVFARDRDGDEQFALFRINLHGQVEPVGNAPPGQNLPLEFSPDGQRLLVASDRADPDGRRRLELWAVDLGSDRWELLTRHRQPPYVWWSSSFWSPDAKRIAYAATDTESLDDRAVVVASSDGRTSTKVFHAKEGSRDFPGAWHPDGQHLSITSEATGQQRAGVLDLRNGSARWLSDGPHDEIAGKFSPDGRQLAAIQFRGVDTLAVVYDLTTGQARFPPQPEGVAQMPDFDSTGRGLVYLHEHPTRRGSLARWNLAAGDLEVLLQPDLERVAPVAWVEPKAIRYRSADGGEVEALLYSPATSSAAVPVPGLVHVHGGPTWQFFRGWDPVAQLLSRLGFVVIEPNVRGSTGYGVDFRLRNRMDLGGGDLADVAGAAAYLKSLPYVDPGRVGVFGISYGGYLTYLALVRTPEIWAAGCAIAGVTDWHREYAAETPALQQYDRELMGDPIANAQLWIDRSPLTFAANLRSRLLILHGVNDPRCPVEQARLFRDRLIELGRKPGVDFEYHEFTGEGHWSAVPAEKMKTYQLLADFFVRTLQSPGA